MEKSSRCSASNRQKLTQYEAAGIVSPKLVLAGIVLALIAFGAESLSETDWNLGEWDSGFADRFGAGAIWISTLQPPSLLLRS